MDENDCLKAQIEALCACAARDGYRGALLRGRRLLLSLRDEGLTPEAIYRLLFACHNGLEDGPARDFAADLLDFVVGWCAPQWDIGGETDPAP